MGLKFFPKRLESVSTTLQGFEGSYVISKGTVGLLVTLGTYCKRGDSGKLSSCQDSHGIKCNLQLTSTKCY